jgi:RNA polymerase sigma-70 factor (ECF subfamily)
MSALFESGSPAGLCNRELLERFASRRDARGDSAELAFATLVARHGPMVLRVCRAVLGDRHDAEDAFQATFLVLARRAGSIRHGGSVGSWLHGVALRVAACARSRAARRHRHERRRAEMMTRRIESDDEGTFGDDDRDRLLHEEIGRLPERFRSVVVLCYLEELTHEMAAGQLGCPVGTIRSRLASAREKLRDRLSRRGVGLAAIPPSLAGPGLVPESAALPSTVPASLFDATVRAAQCAGLGKGAVGSIVTAEAVMLMDGVIKTMLMTKLILGTATVIIAGLMSMGAGVAVYAAIGSHGSSAGSGSGGLHPVRANPKKSTRERPAAEAQKPASKADSGPAKPDDLKMASRLELEKRVQALLRAHQLDQAAFRKAALAARTAEERRTLQRSHPGANPAFYAGAFLQLAETDPGTPAAEDALIWIVDHLPIGSMAERAREMLARDHVRSEKLEPLFNHTVGYFMPGSKATERLFREALAKNPHRKIQGLACYYLARFLESRASFVRLRKELDRSQLEQLTSPIEKESWGQDYYERLDKLDPEAVEREVALLYEQVVKQFGDLPLPDPLPNPTGDRLLPGRPSTLGAAAQAYLHELKHLATGQPAPEIEGVDLDGKPMKLSDYRGKVVGVYFCGPVQLSADGTRQPAVVTKSVGDVARRHANEPFALLGVATVSPGRSSERGAFKSLLNASGLPARFWWDLDPNGNPGPIQTAWNARLDLYVVDRKGVIRYKHVLRPELFEKAVSTLIKER